MVRTEIVTLKIRVSYMELIRKGVKRFEVRDEDFAPVDVIYYVDAATLRPLGAYSVVRTFCMNREQDKESIRYAAISRDDFYCLFPKSENGGPKALWVAEIGSPVVISEVLGGLINGDH